jgi:hypothetical protein
MAYIKAHQNTQRGNGHFGDTYQYRQQDRQQTNKGTISSFYYLNAVAL